MNRWSHWNNASNDLHILFRCVGYAKLKGGNRKYRERALEVEYPYSGRWRRISELPILDRFYIRTKIKGYNG